MGEVEDKDRPVLEAYDLTQIQSYGEVEDKDRPVLEAYDLT